MKVIVTGVQGQDGSILVDKLVSQGHEVVGVGRRRLDDFSVRDRILMDLQESEKNFKYKICDLRESTTVHDLINRIKPDVVYNFGAMSSPAESWDNPIGTLGNDTNAVVNVLDSIRMHSPNTKLVQACTAAIFHSSLEPIHEESPIHIVNPYAAAKYAAYSICNQYRDRYGLNVSNVIMFNHESIWRPEAFVTRKITKAVAKILGKKQDKLRLWTLTPIRDWGWAPEFMEGVIKIGDLPEPENMILSTGNGISLQKFVDYCFEIVGLNSADYVELDPDGLNTGVDISVGDSSKARSLIDWNPSFTWKNIAETMVAHDVKLLAER